MAKQKLDRIRLFLLDMDGTFYLGKTLLPGSKDFVEQLKQDTARQFVFLTNNSSKSRENYLTKLKNMGFTFSPERVMTSGEATAIYLNHHYKNPRVYLVGTPSLEEEFSSSGILLTEDHPDCAVLGFDTTLTYEKLWKLCDLVRAGVPYLATHPDFNCPIENGYMPDIGGMIACVKACTGREPDVVIGKPNRYIIESVSEKFQIPLEEIAMVGDRLYTDIAVGEKAGITSILVLTGETKREDLDDSPIQPDYIFENLGELANVIHCTQG
ncbi:MAG: HAD-IIA family hydrolase [Massiliimalia sp.]|jgi:4-nitrophenyl phosphatase